MVGEVGSSRIDLTARSKCGQCPHRARFNDEPPPKGHVVNIIDNIWSAIGEARDSFDEGEVAATFLHIDEAKQLIDKAYTDLVGNSDDMSNIDHAEGDLVNLLADISADRAEMAAELAPVGPFDRPW